VRRRVRRSHGAGQRHGRDPRPPFPLLAPGRLHPRGRRLKDDTIETVFTPDAIDRASEGYDIDGLPFGVVVVDRTGVIVEYNAYEESLAGRRAADVVGKNFFTDVATCTSVRAFAGRFAEWIDSDRTQLAPFEFVFPFRRGAQRVTILFVRLTFESDRATICIARNDL
jgi:photoactive yellow protein